MYRKEIHVTTYDLFSAEGKENIVNSIDFVDISVYLVFWKLLLCNGALQ